MDDIILASTYLSKFENVKGILDRNFKIKDLGISKYFLDQEVTHSKEGISISKRKYCPDLLKNQGLLVTKPVSTPLNPSM